MHLHVICAHSSTAESYVAVFLPLSGWETADGERPAGTAVRQHEVQSRRHPGQVSRLLLAPLLALLYGAEDSTSATCCTRSGSFRLS